MMNIIAIAQASISLRWTPNKFKIEIYCTYLLELLPRKTELSNKIDI